MTIFSYAEKIAADLFNRSEVYIIPSYQRPYAWTSKQIRELWEDLHDGRRIMSDIRAQGRSYPGYFLGPIFTAEIQRPPDYVAGRLGNAPNGLWYDQNNLFSSLVILDLSEEGDAAKKDK